TLDTRRTPVRHGKTPAQDHFPLSTLNHPDQLRNSGIRWSKKDENHLALVQLAAGLIAYKKANAARLNPAL
ncbi:MAG: hypothetical protein ACREH3_08370, partial [Geminicoccales bacterium]